jgi:hypothetical protein
VFPHFVLDRGKPGTLVVDGNGRRFVNEAISYHQFALEMLAHGKSAIPAFLIADAVALRKYGLGMVRPGGGERAPPWPTDILLRRQHRTAGATIADRPRHPARDGRAHERIMREAVSTPNFGRGSTVYQNHNGDAPPAEPIPISARSRPRRFMRCGFILPTSARRRGWSRTMSAVYWIPAGRSGLICLRQRHAVDHGRHLSGPRDHAGAGTGVRLSRSIGRDEEACRIR